MGSHTLTLCACSPDALRRFVRGSEAAPELPSNLPAGERDGVAALVTGSYSRDPETHEHPDAPALIRAFQALCSSLSPPTTVEVVDDEEDSPELYRFAWAEWDGPDPFELPLSPHGVPAVTYHGPASVERWLETFRALAASGDYDEEYVDADELAALITALEGATLTGAFLFVEY